jgi:hypothetical protein
MKQSGNKQWQRKAQSLLALLTYRLAQGSVETEPFANLPKQICSDRIIANPINTDALKNSLAQVQLGLPKTKRLKRKFANFLKLQQYYEKDREQASDNPPLTIGKIVNGWAGLTGQDEMEFASKVYPKIRKLVIKHYKATGQVGLTDSQAYENPETAFNFMADLLNILVEETPADKKESLVEQMKATLITSSTQSALEFDNELLHDASTMLISEIVTQISEVLYDNPSAKDRLLHPLFGELIVMEANKCGWDSGVPANHPAKLQSVISQNGVSPTKRMMSRSLRRLGRKNVLQNVNDALDGNLVENLNKIISEQTTVEQNKTQSVWEFSPVSTGDNAEIEKSIREWLFRRKNNDASRNH